MKTDRKKFVKDSREVSRECDRVSVSGKSFDCDQYREHRGKRIDDAGIAVSIFGCESLSFSWSLALVNQRSPFFRSFIKASMPSESTALSSSLSSCSTGQQPRFET